MQATKTPQHLHRKADPLATTRETVRRARLVARDLSERRAQRAGNQALAAGRVRHLGPTLAGTARAHLSSSDYQCPELRPYQGRPGAMDAFALPSLINGQRRAHRVASLHTEADGRLCGDASITARRNP